MPTARWRATPTRPTCCRSSPTRVCGRKAIAPSCCRAARSPRCTTAAWRTTAPLRGLDDLQIYSREALPAITRYLAESLGVTFITGTLARAVEQGRVATTAGEFRGDHVFVCPGHDYLTLLPERFAPLNLEVTRLQMLRAAFESAPFALDRPLLTGLSCVHYGAFSDLPSALALREVIQARTPMLLDNGIHLLVSPTPYGELIIGDSHQYGQDAPRSTTRRSTTPCWTWPRRRWARGCAWSSAGRACMARTARRRSRSCRWTTRPRSP